MENKMKIQNKWTFDKVKFDIENNTHLVVSLTAPKSAIEHKRPPIAIVPCVDVSGSMAGEKMEYTKKTLIKLIEHLQPGDYCGLVTFTNIVQVVSPLVEMTQATKENLKLSVGRLYHQGATDFTGGMLAGLEMANKSDLPADTILRVIMFTDGCANQGISDAEGIKKVLGANLGRATLSAFGYGSDANQELLADCGKLGKANYAFVKNPEDALTAFAKELGGLTSVYAQNICVELAPHNGHEISEVVSDVDVEEKDKKVKITFPEMLSQETRNLVVAIKLSAQTKALPREMNIVDVIVDYDFINADGKKEHRREESKAKIQFVKDGDQQARAHEDVDKIVALAQMVKAQLEAEKYVATGNFAGAQQVMNVQFNSFSERGLGNHAIQAKKLADNMANSSVYLANAGYMRSFSSSASRGYGVSSMDSAVVCDAASLGVEFNNEAQASVVESFTTGTSDTPDPVAQPSVAELVEALKTVTPEPAPDKNVSKSKSGRW